MCHCVQAGYPGPHRPSDGCSLNPQPYQVASPPPSGGGDPWRQCRCGHSMLLHDVEDMDGTDPRCCVDGCDQRGCGLVEHHAGDA